MSKIVQTPDVLSGKPRIEGTRISVELVLEDLADGMTPESIAETYAGLTLEDVHAAIAFAIAQLPSAGVAAE